MRAVTGRAVNSQQRLGDLVALKVVRLPACFRELVAICRSEGRSILDALCTPNPESQSVEAGGVNYVT